MLERGAADDFEQSRHGVFRSEKFVRRHVLLERLAELRVDRSRVHAHRDDGMFLARKLDGTISRQLIQRRLRRSVRMPTAQGVITDTTDARAPIRDHRHVCVTGKIQLRRLQHQRREMFHHHRRAERVDAIRLHHVLRLRPRDRSLRPHLPLAQHRADVRHEVQPPELSLDRRRGGFHRRLVLGVHAQHAQPVAVRLLQLLQPIGVVGISTRRHDDAAVRLTSKNISIPLEHLPRQLEPDPARRPLHERRERHRRGDVGSTRERSHGAHLARGRRRTRGAHRERRHRALHRARHDEDSRATM